MSGYPIPLVVYLIEMRITVSTERTGSLTESDGLFIRPIPPKSVSDSTSVLYVYANNL